MTSNIVIFLIAAVIVLFFVSLFRYIYLKRESKKSPQFVAKETLDFWKTMLIIMSFIFGLLLLCFIGLAVLLYTAVAFM